jgi:hypothetical protein
MDFSSAHPEQFEGATLNICNKKKKKARPSGPGGTRGAYRAAKFKAEVRLVCCPKRSRDIVPVYMFLRKTPAIFIMDVSERLSSVCPPRACRQNSDISIFHTATCKLALHLHNRRVSPRPALEQVGRVRSEDNSWLRNTKFLLFSTLELSSTGAGRHGENCALRPCSGPISLLCFPGRKDNVCPWAFAEVASAGSFERVTNCI